MRHLSSFPRRVALGIFCLGLAVTILASGYLRHAGEEHDRERLVILSRNVVSRLTSLVNLIVYGLGGANGVFAASKQVDREEFRDYVASRNLPVEFPGVLGFGFIEYVRREKLEDFLQHTRDDDQPDFRLWSGGGHSDLFIIKFIEPQSANAAAVGFDIGSEQKRREAAELALRSGKPTLTAKVDLVQAPDQKAGFLFLKPVFHRHLRTNTPEARKEAIHGWVYAPFTLDKVIPPLIEQFGRLVSLSIYDGENRDEKNLLFKTDEEVSHLSPGVASTVEIGQRKWTVVVTPRPSFFRESSSRHLPGGVLVIGALSSALVAGGVCLYLLSKERLLTRRLAEGEQFIHGILENANFSIIVTEPDGLIRVFNRTASRLLGYSPEELIGKTTPAVLHDKNEIQHHAEVLSERLGRHVEAGFEVFVAECKDKLADENEWTYVRKDGTRFPVSLSVSAIRDEKQEIVAYVGIGNDISERRQAEQELQRSEERFRRSFVWAAHGMALVSLDGKWLKVNRALCQILGRSETALLSMTFQEVTHPADIDADLVLLQKTLRGEIDHYDLEKRYLHSTGRELWGLLSVSLVRDPDGSPVHFVSQIQDITERKLAEFNLREKTEELVKAKELAVVAAQTRSQFLANMSHEIRTPLTSIIGYSESLMSDNLTAQERSTALKTVIKNGKHLLGVINDILDLSKIEAGKMDAEILSVDLHELISDVTNIMRLRALEKGLSLEVQYSFPLPRRIFTDPLRLKQILINLVSNAVKFTSQGGVRVSVVYHEKPGRVEFAIIDTGIGLTSEQCSNLFQAFSQADASITRRYGGSGLGLTISHSIAKMLGGEVRVESEFGKGSTFSASVSSGPIAPSELVHTFSSNPRSASARPRSSEAALRGRVLIAEDGEDNRNLIAFLLRKTAIDFVFVENGALAVEEVLSSGGFNLVLMDIQMPVMDGYTATSTLREKGVDVPIIALTANAMKEDVDQALAAGCSDFLGKPFTRSEFYSRL